MKYVITALLFFFGIFFAGNAYAQEIEDIAQPEEAIEQQSVFRVVAGEDKNIAVSRKVVFDASLSEFSSEYENVVFRWDFGDGQFADGVDVIHQYNRPGFYRVVLTATSGDMRDTDELIVGVYEDLVVLIADASADFDRINALEQSAVRQGVLLQVIEERAAESDGIIEDSLVKKLIDRSQDVLGADVVIVWTSSLNLGFDVLSQFQKQLAESGSGVDFSQKAIVALNDKSFSATSRIAQSAFEVLSPEYILLIKSPALESVIRAGDSEKVLSSVYETGVENFLVGVHSARAVRDLGVTNFLSYSVNYLINQGVDRENIVLILLIPVVATIIVFTRQVIGLDTFGIYIPTLITLTIFSTGIKYGLFIFAVLFFSATLLRLIIKQFKLLYLPRMALVLSLTAFIILTLFVVGGLTDRTGIIELSIFPILILIILIEKFITVQIEKGFVKSLKPSIGTILVSIGCYYIVSWEALRTIIIAYPEAILLTLVINLLLGRWAGLRLSEYIRFRQVSSFTSKTKTE
jgi:PKD repeat protein